MRRAIDALMGALRFAATAMLLGIVAINAVNVVGRYLLSSPISWAEEVMLFLMIGAVFLANPGVSWEAGHIRMDMALQLVPAGVRRALEALADIVSFSVAALLVWVSVPIIRQLFEFDQRSNAAEIPMWMVQAVIPAGFALSALALIARRLCGK